MQGSRMGIQSAEQQKQRKLLEIKEVCVYLM